MFLSIPHPHYFSYKTNKEVRQIFFFTMLNGLGLALAYIFEPIYLYHAGFDLSLIMWFYAMVYVWYCVFMLFAGKFAAKFGLKRSILLSNFLYLLYWAGLFSIAKNQWLFVLAPIMFALQKSFFWPSFNTLTSLSSNKTERSRQVGVIYVLVETAYIIGPLVGGFISQSFGFYYLFLAAGVMMVFSCIPLFFTKEVKIPQGFSIGKLFAFVWRNPRNFFGYFGYAEDLMQMSLWPVFMYIVLHQFFGVGLVTTFASLVACVLMLYIGKLADKSDKSSLVGEISFFYALTWLFRFTALNTFAVVIFDTLTKIGKGLVNIPIVSLSLEIARQKSEEFTLLYTTFYEFSLAVGKIFTALSAIAILYYTNNVFIVFGLVGVLTLFYSFLTSKIQTHGIKAIRSRNL